MKVFSRGKYSVRRAQGQGDLARALALRALCFGAAGGVADTFDDSSENVLVEEIQSGTLVAAFRMSLLKGARIETCYASQFYDLSALAKYDGLMLELGRFCIHPDYGDPDILRVTWAALTAYVDETGVEMLFGCSSFAGTNAAPYEDAFALLKARHLPPKRWLPRVKAKSVFRYGAQKGVKPDLKRANETMPPLLRTYLMMGGWVSDHAVVDHVMDTLHVFTGLEIGAIPPARKRLLRALV
ncbi:GNAT family N-acetyltransferase [Sulfitobacter donghicola]|uniref:L-ornithine N(alpha)-acyltransferase n=1 Tax=Sulfitobacter donghicola DSW-25 = KCTC 12864 = JCM 14565 TaxID=1300350 RepID=A0A073IW34_9RHOB|nr:GNAT family N-acyltransferase [Sulfitobacter donghicola]KEJ89567.1 ornithine-acyl-ACP acyltransferase [Sulfitobacter donghicola DSW-25 = KCTC 12864 = JCM 14565]KIN69397.1 Ornithine-acyl[acyl carrier protein] N-acyltransferase [Sulfitobacter donghicola DSW-25 = KCTC 12864 = JCM 14565]